MAYTVNYFINKFSKIPNRMWTTESGGWLGVDGKFCADGFCGSIGSFKTEDGKALALLLYPLMKEHSNLDDVVWKINDGHCDKYSKYDYPEPKDRILAALYDVMGINKEFVERVEKLIKDAPDDVYVCDYEEEELADTELV